MIERGKRIVESILLPTTPKSHLPEAGAARLADALPGERWRSASLASIRSSVRLLDTVGPSDAGNR